MFVIRKHFRPTSFIFPLARYCKRSTTCQRKLLSTTQCNHVDDDDSNSLQENPYYIKYERKIKEVKKSGVYTDPTDKVLQRETQLWKRNINNLEKRFVDKKKDENKISGLKLPANLDALIKMELIAEKSTSEISKIWTEYWARKDTVCAVISKDVFASMLSIIKECPLFLYPLPRDQGYEFYLTQFNDGGHCFCTSLINYQVHGEDAPWQLCFKFYRDLKETKGIVLMASEFDSSMLNIMEVQYFAQLQQLFYANPSDERAGLLRRFNHQPDSFKYMDVVKEVEGANVIVRN